MRTQGFTLIETIMVTALTALIFITLSVLIVYFYTTNTYTLQQSLATQEASNGVQNAMRYLREASYGSDGSYPVGSAATSSVTFYANVAPDPYIEKITYVLQNGTLYEVVVQPTGNPLTYSGGTVATSTIATNIVNGTSTPIFTYYSNTGTQLTNPINILNIASIQTTLVVDVDIHRAPSSFTLTGGATLRNLKEQQ